MNDVNAKFGKKPEADGGDRLSDLNVALMDVEIYLQRRALDRARDDSERAYGFINQAAEAGIVDIQCDGEAGDKPGEVDSAEAPATDSGSGEGEEADPGEGDVAS